ncbi:hypothetical protein CDIK_0210 [Cucumispora dikerogammari]|nr:hypothetical protein CDIK_0210 [Cucumispora dikerogammari]
MLSFTSQKANESSEPVENENEELCSLSYGEADNDKDTLKYYKEKLSDYSKESTNIYFSLDGSRLWNEIRIDFNKDFLVDELSYSLHIFKYKRNINFNGPPGTSYFVKYSENPKTQHENWAKDCEIKFDKTDNLIKLVTEKPVKETDSEGTSVYINAYVEFSPFVRDSWGEHKNIFERVESKFQIEGDNIKNSMFEVITKITIKEKNKLTKKTAEIKRNPFMFFRCGNGKAHNAFVAENWRF